MKHHLNCLAYVILATLALACSPDAKSQGPYMIIPNLVANFDEYPINEEIPIDENFLKKNKIKTIKINKYESEDNPSIPNSEVVTYSFDTTGKFISYLHIGYDENSIMDTFKIVYKAKVPGINAYDLVWYDPGDVLFYNPRHVEKSEVKIEHIQSTDRITMNGKKQPVKYVETYSGEIRGDSMLYEYKGDKLYKTTRYSEVNRGLFVRDEYFLYDDSVSREKIKSNLSNDNLHCVIINEYKNNRRIKRTYYEGNSISDFTLYAYDGNENITKESFYLKDNREIQHEEYIYDNSGRLNGFTRKKWDFPLAFNYKFIYDDEKGLVIERKSFEGESLRNYWKFSYEFY